MRDLHLGIDIVGNNRDFLRAVGGSVAAMRTLDTEQRRVSSSAGSLEGRVRSLNKETRNTGVNLQMWARNLGTINGLQRSVFAPAIISNISAMAAGIESIGAAAGVAAVSIGRAGTAFGVVGLAMKFAQKQGLMVFNLGLKDVIKSLQLTGKAQQDAIAKLSKPAAEFVKTIQSMHYSFAQFQLIAQKGMFPGLEAGLKKAIVLVKPLQQVVYDTARVIGYLGDRLGGVLGARKNDIYSILERNVVTLRRMGDATVNFGDSFISVWKAAGPFIGRATRDLVTFSQTVDTYFSSKSGQQGVAKFFDSLRMSWSQWTHSIGNTFMGLRNIVGAALPQATSFDTTIAQISRKFRDWTTDHKYNIAAWFHSMMPDAKALAGLAVDLGKTFQTMAGDPKAQANFKHLADTLGKGVLPIISSIANQFNDHVLPALLSTVDSLTKLLRDAIPGLGPFAGALSSLFKNVVKPLLDDLDKIVQFGSKFGTIGTTIASGLAVGGVLVGWQTLRREIQLTMLLAKQVGGFVPKGTVGRQDFIEAVPGLGARGVGSTAIINQARGQSAVRQGRGLPFVVGGGGGRVPRMAGGAEPVYIFPGESGVVGITPASTIPTYGGSGFGGGVPLPVGEPFRRNGRVVVTRVQTAGQAGDLGATRLPHGSRTSRVAAISANDPVYASLYGDGPAIQPELRRIMRLKNAGIGALDSVGPLAKGGIYGLLTMMLLGVSPSSVGKDVAGQSGNFNLPQHSFAERKIPGVLGLEHLLGGGQTYEEKNIYDFGDKAEATFKKLEQSHNFKGLQDLANQARLVATKTNEGKKSLLEFASAVEKAATGVGDQFDAMKNASGFSMQYIKDSVTSTTQAIKYRLGSDTAKGKDALAQNFAIAVQDVKDSMRQGTILTGQGLGEIRKLMEQELSLYGIKGAQARSYLSGIKNIQHGTQTPASALHQGDPGGTNFNPVPKKKARGGLMPIGIPGTPGRDNVPLVLNGQPVVAAEGEAAAVFTRHQQSGLDQMVRGYGFKNLNDYFNKNNRPNYMASGGFVVGGLGTEGSIVQTGLNRNLDLARQVLGRQFGGGGPGGKPEGGGTSAGSAQVRRWATQALKFTHHFNSANLNALVARIMFESGGNPRAINLSDINAQQGHPSKGLAQTIDSTFQSYRDGSLPNDVYNPIANLVAAINYMFARYGHVVGNTGKGYSRGGLVYAASGYPPRGGGVPTVNPQDAVGPGNDPNKSPSGKKKKGVTLPSGARPSASPFGTGLLKHLNGKKVPKINQRYGAARRLGQAQFRSADLGILRDPITGEDLGIEQLDMLKPIEKMVSSLPNIDQAFSNLQAVHGITDEQATVTLYDSAQYADLTNYLNSHPELLGGKTAADWIATNGNSLEVPNTVERGRPFSPLDSDGMNVQGDFTRGIGAHLLELSQEIALRDGQQPGMRNGKLQGVTGMLQTLYAIQAMRNEVLPNGVAEKAIAERRNRLHQMKIMFDKNVEVRKSIKTKMTNMKKKGYGWQLAVKDNTDLIAKWRDYERSGSNLPKPFKDGIASTISRLEQTNRDLRFSKPKGGDGYTMGLLESEYNDAAKANEYMVGNGNANSWTTSGGRAQAITLSLNTWDAVRKYRQNLDTSVLNQIPQERDVTIASLMNEYNQWAGTHITPSPLNTSNTNLSSQQLEITQQQNDSLARQLAIADAYGNVFQKFAPLMQGRLVGSFDHGGRIPEDGLAYVHRGEYIIPNADGPYRNGMNAPQRASSGVPDVHLHLHGKAGALFDAIDGRVEAKAPGAASRGLGARTRLIRAAPGGTRG